MFNLGDLKESIISHRSEIYFDESSDLPRIILPFGFVNSRYNNLCFYFNIESISNINSWY